MTEQAGKINLNETGLSKITRVLFFCPYQRYSLNEKNGCVYPLWINTTIYS